MRANVAQVELMLWCVKPSRSRCQSQGRSMALQPRQFLALAARQCRLKRLLIALEQALSSPSSDRVGLCRHLLDNIPRGENGLEVEPDALHLARSRKGVPPAASIRRQNEEAHTYKNLRVLSMAESLPMSVCLCLCVSLCLCVCVSVCVRARARVHRTQG